MVAAEYGDEFTLVGVLARHRHAKARRGVGQRSAYT